MSKKHYILIAEVIRRENSISTAHGVETLRAVAMGLASAFSSPDIGLKYQKFDREKFYKACGFEELK